MKIINADFVSIWDDCVEIRTECTVDMETHAIQNIEVVDVDSMDLNICTDEYVEIDGSRFEVEWDDCDDCYYVIVGR